MPPTTRDNFVIVDIVYHIHDEGYYRPSRSLWSSLKKLAGNLRLYIVIIVLSCGIGFLAVKLPDIFSESTPFNTTISGLPPGMRVDQVRSMINKNDGSMEELKSRFDHLSQSQKDGLKQTLGGK